MRENWFLCYQIQKRLWTRLLPFAKTEDSFLPAAIFTCIVSNSPVCLEHKIEFSDVRKVMLAAGRAGNIMLLDEILHLFLAPCVYTAFDGNAVLLAEILDQFVCTETLVAFLTIHQRIGETAQMSAGYPGLGVHQDRTVHTYIVRALLYKFLPPCLFHIIFQHQSAFSTASHILLIVSTHSIGYSPVAVSPDSIT